jgi:hypothetical protein
MHRPITGWRYGNPDGPVQMKVHCDVDGLVLETNSSYPLFDYHEVLNYIDINSIKLNVTDY